MQIRRRCSFLWGPIGSKAHGLIRRAQDIPPYPDTFGQIKLEQSNTSVLARKYLRLGEILSHQGTHALFVSICPSLEFEAVL